MKRNIEIKAKIANLFDFDCISSRALKLSDSKSFEILKQEDLFFTCPNGRLKMRFMENEAQLIFYKRHNTFGPKCSNYDILKEKDPSKLLNVLTLALGKPLKIIKMRHLYLVGQTRIHLDEVENLGFFIELEVVLDENQLIEDGQKIAFELMQNLKIDSQNLIDVAYIDLLQQKTN